MHLILICIPPLWLISYAAVEATWLLQHDDKSTENGLLIRICPLQSSFISILSSLPSACPGICLLNNNEWLLGWINPEVSWQGSGGVDRSLKRVMKMRLAANSRQCPVTCFCNLFANLILSNSLDQQTSNCVYYPPAKLNPSLLLMGMAIERRRNGRLVGRVVRIL